MRKLSQEKKFEDSKLKKTLTAGMSELYGRAPDELAEKP